jgi:hypothetical protein
MPTELQVLLYMQHSQHRTAWSFELVEDETPPEKWQDPMPILPGALAIRSNTNCLMRSTDNKGLAFSDNHRGVQAWFNVRPVEAGGKKFYLVGKLALVTLPKSKEDHQHTCRE